VKALLVVAFALLVLAHPGVLAVVLVAELAAAGLLCVAIRRALRFRSCPHPHTWRTA
jgi:hypothetical protein